MAARRRLDGRVTILPHADELDGTRLARRLAEEGASLVLCGADGERLGALAAELEAASPGVRAVAFVGDPADDETAEALVEMVAELFPDRDAAHD